MNGTGLTSDLETGFNLVLSSIGTGFITVFKTGFNLVFSVNETGFASALETGFNPVYVKLERVSLQSSKLDLIRFM